MNFDIQLTPKQDCSLDLLEQLAASLALKRSKKWKEHLFTQLFLCKRMHVQMHIKNSNSDNYICICMHDKGTYINVKNMHLLSL